MKTDLKHIATIQTGLFAKPIAKGDIVYLQAKHFDENGQLKTSLHPDLKVDTITDKHMLRHGDVLFAAKGTKNFAAWFDPSMFQNHLSENDNMRTLSDQNKINDTEKKTNQPAVASTSFFVIRMQQDFSNKILPEFLVWLINHPTTQKLLKGKAIGSSIVSISKTVLEELEISIPNIETQKVILKITNLRNTEIKLKKQIDSLREQQIQSKLLAIMNYE